MEEKDSNNILTTILYVMDNVIMDNAKLKMENVQRKIMMKGGCAQFNSLIIVDKLCWRYKIIKNKSIHEIEIRLQCKKFCQAQFQ